MINPLDDLDDSYPQIFDETSPGAAPSWEAGRATAAVAGPCEPKVRSGRPKDVSCWAQRKARLAPRVAPSPTPPEGLPSPGGVRLAASSDLPELRIAGTVTIAC